MRSRCLVVLCIAACGISQASANPLPAVHDSISLENGPEINVSGTFCGGGETGEIENLPAPLAYAHVTGKGSSRAEIQSWFRVDGPLDNLQVPIQIAGQVRIRAGNAVFKKGLVWGTTAQLIAISFDGQLGPGLNQVDYQFRTVDCSPLSEGDLPVEPPIPSCPAREQDQPVLLMLNTLTGADNEISMVAAANNQEAFGADFDAVVDPVISFAPGFDATGYAITLSDGVGNTAAPEPSSALLMSSTIGMLLHLRRRSQPSRSP
jgi:hypothetical protein